MSERGVADPPLVRHLEGHLGPLRSGRRLPPPAGGGAAPPLYVAEFADRPAAGAVTLATLGLSERVLEQEGGDGIRQELLFCFYRRPDQQDLERLLLSVAEELLAGGRALAARSLLGPHGPLLPGVGVEALYATAPVYFPDSLAALREVEPPVVFVWLVPVTAAEAAFIARRGGEAFEGLLEELDPDLLDLEREGIVPPGG